MAGAGRRGQPVQQGVVLVGDEQAAASARGAFARGRSPRGQPPVVTSRLCGLPESRSMTAAPSACRNSASSRWKAGSPKPPEPVWPLRLVALLRLALLGVFRLLASSAFLPSAAFFAVLGLPPAARPAGAVAQVGDRGDLGVGSRVRTTAFFSLPLYFSRSALFRALTMTTSPITLPLVPGRPAGGSRRSGCGRCPARPASWSRCRAPSRPGSPTAPAARSQAVALHHLGGPLVGPLQVRRPGQPRADDVAQVAEVLHDLGRLLSVGDDLGVEVQGGLVAAASWPRIEIANRNRQTAATWAAPQRGRSMGFLGWKRRSTDEERTLWELSSETHAPATEKLLTEFSQQNNRSVKKRSAPARPTLRRNDKIARSILPPVIRSSNHGSGTNGLDREGRRGRPRRARQARRGRGPATPAGRPRADRPGRQRAPGADGPGDHGGGGQGPTDLRRRRLSRLAEECASTAMIYLMHVCGTQVIAAAKGFGRPRRGPQGHRRRPAPVHAGLQREGLAQPLLGPGQPGVAADGDTHRISADKSWVTSAGQADSYVVSTRTAGGDRADRQHPLLRAEGGSRADRRAAGGPGSGCAATPAPR